MIEWRDYEDASSLMKVVLKYQTDYVLNAWDRIEVCVPNRDQYGHLRPDWQGHTTLLCATRAPVAPEEAPATLRTTRLKA